MKKVIMPEEGWKESTWERQYCIGCDRDVTDKISKLKNDVP